MPTIIKEICKCGHDKAEHDVSTLFEFCNNCICVKFQFMNKLIKDITSSSICDNCNHHKSRHHLRKGMCKADSCRVSNGSRPERCFKFIPSNVDVSKLIN